VHCHPQEKFVRESEFYHKNFIHTVLSLFFAGTETSSTTLSFALLILLKHLVVLGEHGLWRMGRAVIQDDGTHAVR
jgi:cytochrome P450